MKPTDEGEVRGSHQKAYGMLLFFRKQGKRIRQVLSIAQNHEAGAAFEPQSGETLLVQPLILRETAPKSLMRLP